MPTTVKSCEYFHCELTHDKQSDLINCTLWEQLRRFISSYIDKVCILFKIPPYGNAYICHRDFHFKFPPEWILKHLIWKQLKEYQTKSWRAILKTHVRLMHVSRIIQSLMGWIFLCCDGQRRRMDTKRNVCSARNPKRGKSMKKTVSGVPQFHQRSSRSFELVSNEFTRN